MGLIPDFVLDYISVNTFWTILFIVHALLAVALLGALTHQADVGAGAGAAGRGRRAASSRAFARCRARAMPPRSACCGSSRSSSAPGSTPSTACTCASRSSRQGFWKTQGVFELKEHLAIIGLGLLPIYWFFWKNARNPEYDSARKWLTVALAAMCWFMFLVGHIVNNVRGFGS